MRCVVPNIFRINFQAFFSTIMRQRQATGIAGKLSFEFMNLSFEILDLSFAILNLSFEILTQNFDILSSIC